MAKILAPVFPVGRKAVICDANTEHGFTLNEIVSYVGSVQRMSGNIWHSFENEDGRVDTLIDGEFELLPEKKMYGIALDGCDDSTQFNIELTEEQHKFLLEISEISKKTSRYGCMPTMTVREEPFELYDEDED